MSDLGRFLLAVVVGIVTGMLSGMFGVGGAIVSTPGIRALGASPLAAVGSTLPSVIPSSISGTSRYARAGLIRWDVAAWTAGVGVLAVVGGALLTTVVPGDGHPLMIATALLVAFTAYRLALPSPAAELVSEVGAIDGPGAAAAGPPVRDEPWRLACVGLAAGGLSGLLGIGGGLLMVPAFAGWVRLPLKVALGTSLVCVGVLAVPGTVAHALLGHIDWVYALPLCLGVVPGAQLGAHLAIRSPERALRLTVAAGLGAIALAYFVSELIALVAG